MAFTPPNQPIYATVASQELAEAALTYITLSASLVDPQVHVATHEALEHLRSVLARFRSSTQSA